MSVLEGSNDRAIKGDTVQIPTALFITLCRYFANDDAKTEENERYIRSELDVKLQKIINRKVYERSKTAQSSAERLAAKNEYIQRRRTSFY